MKRVVIGLPCLVSGPEQDSVLRELSEGWRHLAGRSKVFRLSASEESLTPEAAWLGLNPVRVQIPQGPLTIAALKADPPERSVHFHVSALSLNDSGELEAVQHLPTADEEAAFVEQAERLSGRALTFLKGWQTDHALVWENGSIDLGCQSAQDSYGKPLSDSLPVGEGEPMLRRLIDDSVNLLNELPFNHIRREEGRQPINVLWPWGPGFRPETKMLPLERGEMAYFGSASLRLAGLCRLYGYVHSDWRLFGPPVRVNWKVAKEIADPATLILHPIQEMQRAHRLEELAHFLEELFERVIEPLLDETDLRLTLLAPAWPGQPERCSRVGLGLSFDTRRTVDEGIPFDERVLDDNRLRLLPLHEAMQIAHQWG